MQACRRRLELAPDCNDEQGSGGPALRWSHPTPLTQDRINHFIRRLRRDRDPTLRAVQRAEPAPQQTQVVIDFRDRADGRSRRIAGCFLFDGNRRRETMNVLDLRLGHLTEKLPRVAR